MTISPEDAEKITEKLFEMGDEKTASKLLTYLYARDERYWQLAEKHKHVLDEPEEKPIEGGAKLEYEVAKHDLQFRCEWAVYVKGGQSSICYCADKSRAELVVKALEKLELTAAQVD